MIPRFWPEWLKGWSCHQLRWKGCRESPCGMKDQEFSVLLLYDLESLKLFLVHSRINYIRKSKNDKSQVSYCQKRVLQV